MSTDIHLDFRNKLIENERFLENVAKNHGLKYAAYRKIEFFEDLPYLGDLKHYINTSMHSKDMEEFSQTVHDLGYKTCLDMLDEYIDSLPEGTVEDVSDVKRLVLGAKYSTFQIAALVKKYNVVIGMQFVEKDDEEYVVIKSTLEDEDSQQGYHDHWMDGEKLLCYYTQQEKEENLRDFTYSYTPNRKIFDSIFHNSTSPLNIYVFTRSKRRIPYTYNGVFRAVATCEGGKAFVLANESLSSRDQSYVNVVSDFERELEQTPVEEVISKKRTLVEKTPEKSDSIASSKPKDNAMVYVSERDYIAEAKRRQKIGDIGEEAVLNYEKRKIRDSLKDNPALAEQLISAIRQVSKEPGGERFGYDISSFNIVNGEPVPIFIEVKTTTGTWDNDFFMTQHELQTARSEEINRNYYIYRVYNINSDQPCFYFMKGTPKKEDDNDPSNFYFIDGDARENFIKLEPFIYLAKIK